MKHRLSIQQLQVGSSCTMMKAKIASCTKEQLCKGTKRIRKNMNAGPAASMADASTGCSHKLKNAINTIDDKQQAGINSF